MKQPFGRPLHFRCQERFMDRIEVNHIAFSYDTEMILKDLSLTAQEGDFVCILGESGCGKSTLLRLLAGLSHPDSGEIKIDGQTVEGPGADRGVVFQDYSLYPWMTTGKNLMLSLRQRFPEKGKAELKEQILYFLRQVGLAESVYQKYPFELSGGMRQRCAICRAFALNPPILLMDEPFGALDAVTRFRLQNMLQNLWNQGGGKKKTIVFVTHDVDEAMYLATKIYVLGMRPSQVIYSHRFFKKESVSDRKSLLFQKEYIELREALLNALNTDIEERTKENEEKNSCSPDCM